jgi:hypothetical protein
VTCDLWGRKKRASGSGIRKKKKSHCEPSRLTGEEVAGDQWLVASEEEIPYPAQTTNHKSQVTTSAKRPWCGNLRLREICRFVPPEKQLGSIEENPPRSPLRKPHSLIFLSPPRERIEVRGNDPIPFFTLTLTPFDKLTALSQSKGSPLKGERN